MACAFLMGMVLLAGCGGEEEESKEAENGATGEQPSEGSETPADGLPPTPAPAQLPRVLIATTHGQMVFELYPDRTPQTVARFLGLVEAGFYDGTIFHQVSAGFLMMGGRFGSDYREKTDPTGGSGLLNEAKSGLKNEVGTIAMSHEPGFPNSARTEFFINLGNNTRLDYRPPVPGSLSYPNPEEPGYCAFGRVVEGVETLRNISAVSVQDMADFVQVPAIPVVVNSITRHQ